MNLMKMVAFCTEENNDKKKQKKKYQFTMDCVAIRFRTKILQHTQCITEKTDPKRRSFESKYSRFHSSFGIALPEYLFWWVCKKTRSRRYHEIALETSGICVEIMLNNIQRFGAVVSVCMWFVCYRQFSRESH